MSFLDVMSLDVYTDKMPSPALSGEAGGTAADERVEHRRAGLGELLDQPFHVCQAVGAGMSRLCPAAPGGNSRDAGAPVGCGGASKLQAFV